MTTKEEFLKEIDAYLSRTGMTGKELGIAALNDAGFVYRQRSGGDLMTGTMDKVRTYMKCHPKGTGKAKPAKKLTPKKTKKDSVQNAA